MTIPKRKNVVLTLADLKGKPRPHNPTPEATAAQRAERIAARRPDMTERRQYFYNRTVRGITQSGYGELVELYKSDDGRWRAVINDTKNDRVVKVWPSQCKPRGAK